MVAFVEGNPSELAATIKSKGNVTFAASRAEPMAKQLDQAVDAATKDYEDALKALKGKIADRKKNEPPAAKMAMR